MTISSDLATVTPQSEEKKRNKPPPPLPKAKELEERRKEFGLVYTMFMRFARRAEGLKSSRAVFAKARKEKLIPWEVYESSGTFKGFFNLVAVYRAKTT